MWENVATIDPTAFLEGSCEDRVVVVIILVITFPVRQLVWRSNHDARQCVSVLPIMPLRSTFAQPRPAIRVRIPH